MKAYKSQLFNEINVLNLQKHPFKLKKRDLWLKINILIKTKIFLRFFYETNYISPSQLIFTECHQAFILF